MILTECPYQTGDLLVDSDEEYPVFFLVLDQERLRGVGWEVKLWDLDANDIYWHRFAFYVLPPYKKVSSA